MSHFKAKMHQIRFPASVRSFIRPFVSQIEFDTDSYDCMCIPGQTCRI